MVNISNRLRKIAEHVPPGSAVADIGSDHALLPVFLALSGNIRRAVAGEIHDGPLQAARRQVARERLEAVVDVRKGDGLQVLDPGEADCIVIAGMGGHLISSILGEGKEKLDGVSRLVLQPNVGEDQVRQWLRDNSWHLVGEDILEEDGHIYEILVAEPAERHSGAFASLYREMELPGGCRADEETLLLMGPYLIREASGVFLRKWRQEAEKLRNICSRIRLSRTSEAESRLEQMERKRSRIEEVLACIQRGKPSSR
jgi:tRNA (adenine22-N1)-methyltransferase